MTVGDIAAQARAQWVAMMGSGGAQDRAPGEPDAADLPAPAGLTAITGRGQVTLRWEPVEGAIGYAVHRATASTGPFTVVDHGGGDVLAVPHGPYADTTVEPERSYWYAVAPLATVTAMGPLCTPVKGAALGAASDVAPLVLRVEAAADAGPLSRPWRFMVGSEHLSHLLSTDRTGGREIGPELRAALARVHDELGVETVRAHGILDDDLGVYREVSGSPAYDFSGIDQVYDTVLALGMRPIVELGFMPRDLASDPSRTVFTYRGIISPPKDWDRWAALVRALVSHLVDRYGLDEVRDGWAFEVWNEANLSVFWSGTPAEYWRLYELAARAVKDVDPGLRVGGPATAAVGWVDRQLEVDAPVDFVSTHIYGSPPLDLRGITGDRPLWWTEWGVTATHGNEVNDTVFAATFLLRGMRSAAGRIESLAPWVASDHFEELGRPPRFLHGGFGLLTVGNLAKPKFWALWLAQRLGDTAVPARLSGDGADSLVETWTARGADGTVGALVWNGTLDHSKRDGDKSLDRTVMIRFEGLTAGRYEARQWRVDADHGNVAARWQSMGGGDWPSEAQWAELATNDVLPETMSIVEAEGGAVELTVDLPNPSIAYVELKAAG
ncbi:beta-xylosidase [Asanoa ishikariensis]|uniref:Xylan 1,4-beta-xylosidase n=1 Tax=Asanoa ishikariensis TaxID=137265 RepID=A0A1H3TBC9_9ACTN|nr:xylan 1,4-beta-xylosidase [Asanoa ishikariensis]GIF62750.1 beta-xylosidase [Asanoa ishikariensis]SDZ47410.1 xylan 1,4-beta-xylosidase [Asanoa ishikariensis]